MDGRVWKRLAPTLIVSSTLALTALVLLPPMYWIGKRHDDERIFLRNYRAPNEYEVFSNISMDYARNSDEPNDVIFVGDSSLRFDLRPSEFERETGLKAYNLGSAGLITVRGYTRIAAAYLASRHPKPRLIVLSILPTALDINDDYSFLSQEMQDIKARFLWCFGPGTEDMRPHNSFLYHVRQGFKYTYGRLVGGFDHFADEPVPFRGPETYRSFARSMASTRGVSEAPERTEIPIRSRDRSSTLDPFKITDLFREELSELVRLTSDHGIPLLIRLTPYSGEAAEHSRNLRAWAEELESKHPHVIVARPEVLLYDRELFYDENHLRPGGAARFTSLVAGEVKQVLAAGREGTSLRQSLGSR
jgi:hypothetical protein